MEGTRKWTGLEQPRGLNHKLNDETLPHPRMDVCPVNIWYTLACGCVLLPDESSLCGKIEVMLWEYLYSEQP